MLDFGKFLRVEARVVVARDVLNEENAIALVSKDFADKIGLKDGQTLRITREKNSVVLKAVISEFAEGVDVVIPVGFYASQLADFNAFKQFTASIEFGGEVDSVDKLVNKVFGRVT